MQNSHTVNFGYLVFFSPHNSFKPCPPVNAKLGIIQTHFWLPCINNTPSFLVTFINYYIKNQIFLPPWIQNNIVLNFSILFNKCMFNNKQLLESLLLSVFMCKLGILIAFIGLLREINEFIYIL